MRLLLNEQISPAVAAELRRKGYDVVSASDLGTRGANDWQQLSAAASARRALVTYNIADFQRLLVEWARKGHAHSGIIFVSEKTIPQRSLGPLVLALGRLLDEFPTDEALANQGIYLTKG